MGEAKRPEPLRQHPLSAVFPKLSEKAFGELRADIAAHGLRLPIVLFLEQVLDGWHRHRACIETGIAPRYEEFNGTEADARRFVISANVLRRHLDESQRAMIAARLAQLPASRPKEANLPTYGETVAAAAELLNISERTVKDARTVLASGDAALIAAADRGEVAVSRAAKDLRISRPKAAKTTDVERLPAVTVMPKTVEEWAASTEEERQFYCTYRNPQAALNRQEEGEDDNLIDWARLSWNPITGCQHNCPYCYARDIAERFQATPAYPHGFLPTFHADHLSAPLNGRPRASGDERDGRIFTGSMADIFGRWVPTEWIAAVLDVMRLAPQWEFLMLTKFPKRMAEFAIPDNAWAGTSVDCQARVAAAEAAFADIGGKYHWLSCEPLLEPLRFNHLDRFDLLVIGGASPSRETPRWIPPFSWLDDLQRQADEAGCAVFLKSNLYRKEKPKQPRYRFTPEAPPVFHYLKPDGPVTRPGGLE
jgi:protein gp37